MLAATWQPSLAQPLEVPCAASEASQCQCRVLQHTWGADASPLHPPFDYVVACGDRLSVRSSVLSSEPLCLIIRDVHMLSDGCTADVMYITEAIPALLRTLCAVSAPQTRVFLAQGCNRQAEAAFLEQCQPHFTVRTLDSAELHPDFHSVDICVWELQLRH